MNTVLIPNINKRQIDEDKISPQEVSAATSVLDKLEVDSLQVASAYQKKFFLSYLERELICLWLDVYFPLIPVQ